MNNPAPFQPTIITGCTAAGALERLKQNPDLTAVRDTYREQLEELFLLRNPRYRFDKDYAAAFETFLAEHQAGNSLEECGNWVFYPWLHMLVHLLPEELFFEMKTGRNRNLITDEEQRAYYGATVGIAGLSVGSHAALTIAMTGGAKRMRLADPDTISGPNLNRIRTGVQNIGLSKAVVIARLITEMNPYCELVVFPEGLSEANLPVFMEGNGRLDVLVEEMDNPYFKIRAREAAKALRIPVVMGTDNGDNIIVDIERYDTDPETPLLNGLIGELTAEQFRQLDPKDLPRTAATIAGAGIATPRMQQSVLEVGKSLYSWPQLGTAANLCGTALAYLVRKIAIRDQNTRSGRYQVSLDAVFEDGYHSPEKEEARKRHTEEFFKTMGM